jgi:probable phosphoglycerate mutase
MPNDPTGQPALARESFWFLRHGETDWNARNLSQGNIDVPLNAAGLAQARQAATGLVGQGIAAIVASPLSRARITAEMVGAALSLPVAIDPDLREASYGVREQQPMDEWFQDWVAGSATPEGAEPFAALRRRAVTAINRALTAPAPVLVVAHGGLFRALRAEMGLEPNIRTPNGVPYWCVPGTPSWTLSPLG